MPNIYMQNFDQYGFFFTKESFIYFQSQMHYVKENTCKKDD